ncbi:hypothetical protein [Faecalimonas umbilicata]|uniref:hypothetical protein n=1 Tax=Faecalimonas umbilicata TaxID=1912855 RepID=UPI002943B969|nr:hypothetical protein [Faecalimonas umbilicata]
MGKCKLLSICPQGDRCCIECQYNDVCNMQCADADEYEYCVECPEYEEEQYMDEKKVREAIYCMKSFADDTVCEECDNYDRCDHTMAANNARTAIEALEKQLAVKPKEVVGGIYREFYECKNCGSEIEPLDIYEDYCKWCGQRLDWTES